MKNPNNLVLIACSSVVGIFIAPFTSGIFPEGSSMRVIGGVAGLSAPPVFALYLSYKKWGKYAEEMKQKYENAKEKVRGNPNNKPAREHMVEAGRAYYSCLRENGMPTIYDEQAVANDLKAIIG